MRTTRNRRRHRVIFFALGCLGLLVQHARAADIAPQPLEGKIKWVYSYAEGKKLAAETGKPIFLVFRCER